ncbi:MAG: hypothetical protein JRI50_04480 [Deltaproteobacteria bacterium]|nr:hypothetical protein [Deltaproteobacteria bacterium]
MLKAQNCIKQDGIALLIFAALSGYWTVLSWPQGIVQLNSDQQNILLMVLKEIRPELYQTDSLFSNPELFAFYTPFFRTYLAKIASWTGDLAVGYKLLVFPLNLIFLLGAYNFFRYLFKQRALALLLAFFSSLPFAIPGVAEYAGIGPVSLMMPRAVFMAFFPWLLWGFYRYTNDWQRLMLVFFGVGLAANFHPVSGYLLAEIFGLTLLFQQRFSRSAFLGAIGGGLAAMVGALPTFWQYMFHTTQMQTEKLPSETLNAILEWRFPHNLYPPLNLAQIPEPVIHVLTALLGVGCLGCLVAPATIRTKLIWVQTLAILTYLLFPEALYYLIFLIFFFIMWFPRLSLTPDLERTGYLVGAMFCVAILLTTVLQDFGLKEVFPGLAAIQTRAARFSPFFLFILAGYTIITLISMSNWSIRKVLCLSLLLVALVMHLRLTFRSYIHHRPRPAQAALVDLAYWAKAHTPQDAVFLFDSLTFRLLAERAITGCGKDGGIWFFAPRGLGDWYKHMQELAAVDHDPHRLQELAVRHGADYFVVQRGPDEFVAEFPVAYQNDFYYLIRR